MVNKERYAKDPDYRNKIDEGNNAWAEANRPKINARVRHRRANNPKVAEAELRRRLLRTYGITLDDYYAMVGRQDGLCGLCRRRPRDKLCVDHSHETDLLRLLLCRRCNAGLGNFGDDPDLMLAGFAYLQIFRVIHARLLAAGAKPIPIRTSKPKKRKDTQCLPTSPPTKKPRPRD